MSLYEHSIDINSLPFNVEIFRYIDNDFVVVALNHQAKQTMGLVSDEVFGKKLLDLFPQAKQNGFYEFLLKGLNTQNTSSTPNPAPLEFQPPKEPLRQLSYLPNGDLMVTYSAALNSSQKDEKLNCLMNLIDKSQTVVFYMKASARWPVEFVSSSVDQWGYTKSEFESKKRLFVDLIFPEDLAQVEAFIRDATLKQLDQYTQTYRIVTADGGIRWVNDRRVVEKNNSDAVTRYLCTLVDVSEQQRHQSLSESLGGIVENSTNGIYVFRKADLKFLYLNKGAQQSLGYSLDELKDMTPVDIKTDFTLAEFKTLLQKFEDSGLVKWMFEAVHRRKDGSTYNAEISLQEQCWADEPCYVAFVSDISERKVMEMQLAESEKKFKLITESVTAGIFIYGDYFEYVNPAFIKLSGYSIDELKGMRPWEIVSGKLQEQFKAAVESRLKGEEFPGAYHGLTIINKSGEEKTLWITTQTIFYDGHYAGIGSVVDMTDLQKAQAQLKLFSQVIEQTESLIRITNKDGVITYANPAFCEFTGYACDEILGQSSRILKSGLVPKTFYHNLWSTLLSGEAYKDTFVNRKKNGDIYYEQQTITPILDDNNEVQFFVSSGQDITERVLDGIENEMLARTDKLTGASNRHKGDEFLQESLLRAQRYNTALSVILLDIDYFKKVNDSFGHQVGDQVLVEVSDLIAHGIRQTDLLVRWGGEEFLIIIPDTGVNDAANLAEKLRHLIASYQFVSVGQVTISCGVTEARSRDTAESLLLRADELLYEAKLTGRNKTVVC